MLVSPSEEKGVQKRRNGLCFPLWHEKASRILQDSTQAPSHPQSPVYPMREQVPTSISFYPLLTIPVSVLITLIAVIGFCANIPADYWLQITSWNVLHLLNSSSLFSISCMFHFPYHITSKVFCK